MLLVERYSEKHDIGELSHRSANLRIPDQQDTGHLAAKHRVEDIGSGTEADDEEEKVEIEEPYDFDRPNKKNGGTFAVLQMVNANLLVDKQLTLSSDDSAISV